VRRLRPRSAARRRYRRGGGLERGEELTLRSAETTVDPESGELLEKILVGLAAEHWSGNSAERIWAKPLGGDVYEVRNTPWYAYDLNWGDEVRCEGLSEAGLPIVVEIVKPGGHQTLRLFFEGAPSEERERVLRRINELGATYENADDVLYSIDLEPDVAPAPILDLLALEAEQGTLSWETGWTFKADS
jgi:hypothetical protein